MRYLEQSVFMNCIQQKPTNLPIPLLCFENAMHCISLLTSSEDIDLVDLKKKSIEV